MADYLTVDDLTDAFGEDEIVQLADRDGDGFPDAVVIDPVIDRAEAALNNACRGRYRIPLSTLDQEIKGALLDLARYWLYEDAVTEVVATRYEAAVKLMNQIAAGKRILAANPAPDTERPLTIHAQSDPRAMTRDDVRGVL